MTGVFDSIAYLTLKSLELFEDSIPKSHRSFLLRRITVASVTYGWLAGVLSVWTHFPHREIGVDVRDTVLNNKSQVKLYNLDTSQLIQSNEHVLAVINVGENENEGDVINEACALDISPAFSEKLTNRYLLVRTRRLSHSPWIAGSWAWWI